MGTKRSNAPPPPIGLAGRGLFEGKPGPLTHLLDITLSFRRPRRLSDAGKKKGSHLAPLGRSSERPADRQGIAPRGPGSVHREMYGLASIGLACERVSTPFAVGPGGGRGRLSVIGGSSSLRHRSRSIGCQNDEGPPEAMATLHQVARRGSNRRRQAGLSQPRRTSNMPGRPQHC